MTPQMNPLMRVMRWILTPLRDELLASLEEDLAHAQEKARRAEEDRDVARRERENALVAVDQVSARNGRLFEEIGEVKAALDAMERHRRGEPS